MIGAESIVLYPGRGKRCTAKGCSNVASAFARCCSCGTVAARCACSSASRAAAVCCEDDDAPPWERA